MTISRYAYLIAFLIGPIASITGSGSQAATINIRYDFDMALVSCERRVYDGVELDSGDVPACDTIAPTPGYISFDFDTDIRSSAHPIDYDPNFRCSTISDYVCRSAFDYNYASLYMTIYDWFVWGLLDGQLGPNGGYITELVDYDDFLETNEYDFTNVQISGLPQTPLPASLPMILVAVSGFAVMARRKPRRLTDR